MAKSSSPRRPRTAAPPSKAKRTARTGRPERAARRRVGAKTAQGKAGTQAVAKGRRRAAPKAKTAKPAAPTARGTASGRTSSQKARPTAKAARSQSRATSTVPGRPKGAAFAKASVAKKALAVRKTAALKKAATNKKAAAAKTASRLKKAASRKASPVTKAPRTAARTTTTKPVEHTTPSPSRAPGATARVPGIPSTLSYPASPSAARSGAQEMRSKHAHYTDTSPVLTSGDIDATWEEAASSGDEAPGGDNPTPDQDVVEEIGHALGVEYADAQELEGGAEIEERDRHRWEYDPASAEDYIERMKNKS